MSEMPQIRTRARSIRTDARLLVTYARGRMSRDPVSRVRRLYEMIPPDYLFADHSTYINYGYWDDGCTSLDDASEALAAVMADTAGFQNGETILDVGFGYGDQDFFWARKWQLGKIFGLNITPGQVVAANRRARHEHLDDVLDFRQGSAMAMPFEAASFDRVVAMECAFHFSPRTAFFDEAFRVLRPGGVLATADIVPRDASTQRLSITSQPLVWVAISVGDENWHTKEVYADKLAAAGFADVRMESIRERTFEPWRQHIVSKLREPAFQQRIGPIYYRILTHRWQDQPLLEKELELLDYVLVVARKPLETQTA